MVILIYRTCLNTKPFRKCETFPERLVFRFVFFPLIAKKSPQCVFPLSVFRFQNCPPETGGRAKRRGWIRTFSVFTFPFNSPSGRWMLACLLRSQGWPWCRVAIHSGRWRDASLPCSTPLPFHLPAPRPWRDRRFGPRRQSRR